MNTSTASAGALTPMQSAIRDEVLSLVSSGALSFQSDDSELRGQIAREQNEKFSALKTEVAETLLRSIMQAQSEFKAGHGALLAELETLKNKRAAKAAGFDETAARILIDRILQQYATKTAAISDAAKAGAMPLPPLLQVDPFYVENDCTDEIAFCVATLRHIMISGPSGSGKTFPAEMVLRSLGRRYIVLSCAAGVSLADITVRPNVRATEKGAETYYTDGALVRALRGNFVVIVDEFDKLPPELQAIFNGITTPGGSLYIPQTGETLYPGDEFLVIATCNGLRDETGNYGSSNRFDSSLPNRFTGVAADYLTKKEETQILVRVGLTQSDAESLVGLFHGLRQIHFAGKISAAPSTRIAVDIARMMLGQDKHGKAATKPVPMAKAFARALLNLMPPAEAREALAVLKNGI